MNLLTGLSSPRMSTISNKTQAGQEASFSLSAVSGISTDCVSAETAFDDKENIGMTAAKIAIARTTENKFCIFFYNKFSLSANL